MNLFSLTYYAWRKLTPGFGRYLLIFLLLFLFVPSVTAQGIGISPNKLEIETFKGNEVKKQLTIFNPSNEKLDFFVKASDWFSFFPEEFSVNPNENKKVVVKVKPDRNGEFEETINVLLKPRKNGGLAINLGAAVRVKIKSETKTNHLVGAATTASIVICGLSLFLLRKNS